MNKNRVLELCRNYGVRPNKKLGQNFLVDDGIAGKIITALDPLPGDDILEIGPGLGALTEKLVELAGSVTAVEIDSGLAEALGNMLGGRDNFILIHGDFLKSTVEDRFLKIVSNLPYYCSSEILFRIAEGMPGAKKVYVMLQKEMAQRLLADPGTPEYGALTVSLNLYCSVEKLFRVPPESFYPRPDVSSLFICITRREDMALQGEELAMFHRVVKSAFWGRRKTLLKSLSNSPHLSFARAEISAALDQTGIDSRLRGETLSVDDYVCLAQHLNKVLAGSN